MGWYTASTWPAQRLTPPSSACRPALQLNYARDADYISAACIMFDRERFLSLGGFDAMFGKGYYEDTDVAMAFAAAGLAVTYQPMSVVRGAGIALGPPCCARWSASCSLGSGRQPYASCPTSHRCTTRRAPHWARTPATSSST
jgi:hypothetical protein